MSLDFSIANTICKLGVKFITYNPSPGDCGGVSHTKKNSYHIFPLCWTKWLSQNFWSVTSGKKRVRGLVALQFLFYLKEHYNFSTPFDWALSRHYGTTKSMKSPLVKKQENKKQIKAHPWFFFWLKIYHSKTKVKQFKIGMIPFYWQWIDIKLFNWIFRTHITVFIISSKTKRHE